MSSLGGRIITLVITPTLATLSLRGHAIVSEADAAETARPKVDNLPWVSAFGNSASAQQAAATMDWGYRSIDMCDKADQAPVHGGHSR